MESFEATVEVDTKHKLCYVLLSQVEKRLAPEKRIQSYLVFRGEQDKQTIHVDLDYKGRVVGVELVGFVLQK